MKRKQAKVASLVLILLVIVVACSTGKPAGRGLRSPKVSPIPGQELITGPAWETEWDRLVNAGQREGKVVIYCTLAPRVRTIISEAVKKKFGMETEFVVATPNEIVRRILNERRNQIYIPDVHIGGIIVVINDLAQAGVFDSLEPALILPEVTDTTKWLDGKLGWIQGEKNHVALQFYGYVSVSLVINTDMVKQDEIRSYRDLLAPKWNGKIIMGDPSLPSSASAWFTRTVEALGENFMRDLVKQNPLVLRDERLITEWLSHGKYSVAIGVKSDTVMEFINSGAHLKFAEPKDFAFITPGDGIVSVMNRAPHPNEAKLFINWLLSREGQTLISESADAQSRRLDVPTDKLGSARVREPGVKYTEDTVDTIGRRPQWMSLAREIFGSLSGR